MNIRSVSIIIILAGMMLGVVSYINEPVYDIYRVEYEFNASDRSSLSENLAIDTLYIYNDLLIRNFITSVADTSQQNGVFRSELKVYVPKETGPDEMMLDVKRLFEGNPVSVYNTKYEGSARSYHEAIAYLLSALLLTAVLRSVLPLFKKNGSIQNNTGAISGL